MKNTIKYLDWDSQFFGFRIGELIRNDKLEESALENAFKFDLIYVRSDSEKEYLIDGFKNELSEIKIVFIKGLESSIHNKVQNIEHFKNESSLDVLYDLAFESGKMSRFKLDKKFTEAQFKRLYQKWIDNAINKTFADGTLVYKNKEEIVGFITYSFNKQSGSIGLIGVDPHFQGQGIGSKLIAEVETLLYNLGIQSLSIPTQLKNEQALRFYKKLGYKISSRQYINHYWKI